MLIGTRRTTLGLLPGARILDLDAPEYLDRADLTGYARQLLLADRNPAPPGPYPAKPEHAGIVAAAIATRAGRSFLIAQLTARALAADPQPVDTRQTARQERLPATVGAAMDRYLACIPEDERRVRDLLRPLAWAEGDGLADDNLWAALATALGTSAYQGHDVRWLRATAAGDLLQTTRTDQGNAWRLFHAALAEHLRAGQETEATQRSIAEVLQARVPRRADTPGDRSRPDWRAADAYTRAHLATHAGHGGCLEPLLEDLLFVLAARTDRLIPALATGVHTATGRQLARVVQRASQRLRDPAIEQRAAYLHLVACQYGAAAYAERIAGLGLRLPWLVRWAHRPASPPHQVIGHHDDWVTALAVAKRADERPILISGGDSTVRVWDLERQTVVGQPLYGHEKAVTGVTTAVLSDGRLVAVSASSDRTLRVWDLGQGIPVGESLQGHEDEISAVAATVLGDGRRVVVSGSHDATVRVWDLERRTLIHPPLRGHTEAVFSVATAVLSDGRPVAVSAGSDHTVRVWDLDQGRSIGEPLTGHTGAVRSVVTGVLADGAVVAVTSDTHGIVRIWDLDRRVPIGRPLTCDSSWIHLALLPRTGHQDVLATGGFSGELRLWELPSGRALSQPAPGPEDFIKSLAATSYRDERWIITGSTDHSIRLWRLEDLLGHSPSKAADPGRLWSVALTTRTDGQAVLVAGDEQGVVWLHDPSDGRPIAPPLCGHADWVTTAAAATLSDGRSIAVTGSRDHTMRLWDVDHAQPIGEPLTGHDGWIRDVATTTLSDGRRIAVTVGHDMTVRRWDLEWPPRSSRPLLQVDLGSTVNGLAPLGSDTVVAALHGGLVALRMSAGGDSLTLTD